MWVSSFFYFTFGSFIHRHTRKHNTVKHRRNQWRKHEIIRGTWEIKGMKRSKHSKHKNTLRKPINRNKEPWYLSKSFFSSSFPLLPAVLSKPQECTLPTLWFLLPSVSSESNLCQVFVSFTKQPDANVTVSSSSLFLLPYIPKTNSIVLSCLIRGILLFYQLWDRSCRGQNCFFAGRVTLLCVGLLGVRKFWKEREDPEDLGVSGWLGSVRIERNGLTQEVVASIDPQKNFCVLLLLSKKILKIGEE